MSVQLNKHVQNVKLSMTTPSNPTPDSASDSRSEIAKPEAASFSVKDLTFLKPLITYYKLGGFNNLPIQVENAIDSLILLMGENI